MSHNAELSRRMARARISVLHVSRGSIRRGDTFARTESEAMRRIPWARPRLTSFRRNLLIAIFAVSLFVGILQLSVIVAEAILWVWP